MVAGGAGQGSESASRRCESERAPVLSAAPYGHRALVRVRAPGCCSWRLRPGSSLSRHWPGPPSARQDIPPLPCATHSAGRRSDASCRALWLPGGRWGVCAGRRGVPGVQRSQARPSSPGDDMRSRGDAPGFCFCCLQEKVHAQLRTNRGPLSRKRELF